MVSCRPIIKKGLLLGFAAGLIATVFDSLYMVAVERFAPFSYPVQILLLNTLLWSFFGFLCSLFFFFFAVKRKGFVKNESFYWCLFFLLPFTLLYGISGRLYFPMGNWFMEEAPAVFDRNLSIVWVMTIAVFAILHSKKQSAKDYFSSTLFIPEITAVIFFLSLLFKSSKY